MTVLIVEDNASVRRLLRRAVQQIATQIWECGNGAEALAVYSEQLPNVVLMDVRMPTMDGLTATRRIRETEKETQRHLPIIAMTAHAMKGDRDRCLEAGMDEYVAKPINRQDLEQALKKIEMLLDT